MSINTIKKNLLCLLLSFIVSFNICAQEQEKSIWNTSIPCIYSENVTVKNNPYRGNTKIDTLFQGDTINIIKTEEVKEKDGYSFYAQIAYNKGNEHKVGYINYDDICFIHLQKDSIKFLLQLDNVIENEYEDEKEAIYKIKVINKKGTICQYKFKDKKSSSTYMLLNLENKLLSNEEKLHNVENILTIYSAGEACAIPSYYYHLAWTGKDILPIISTWGTGEGGAYTSEEVIFPNNNLPANIILKLYLNKEEEEYYEGKEYSTPPESVYVEVYQWDGKKVNLIKQNRVLNQ